MTTSVAERGTSPAAPQGDSLPVRDARDTDEGRRWPLSQLFAIGAAAFALLTVVGVVLGVVAVAGQSGARDAQVQYLSPVRDAGNALSIALLDQETGVRGFGLASQEDFLEPYQRGLDAEQAAVAAIRTGVADSGDQRVSASIGTALDEVEAAAQRWRSEYADLVVTPTGAAPDQEQGRMLFEDARQRIGELQTELDVWRDLTRVDYQNATGFLTGVLVGVGAVLLVALAATGLGLRFGVLRPVSHLAAEVRAVVSGDASRPVAAEGPREIYQLANDVEAMRRHILSELEQSEKVNHRLDVQARDLERSNRDLEQFAYVASHDLQEPLRKVSSFCQLLQRRYGGQLDERADQYIAFAVDGAQRMQQLINDLLAFSRVGRTTEGFAPVDLGAVATTVTHQLDAARIDKDGEIEVAELPTVQGDQALLRQLLVNLIGNGLKFSRDGVPPVVRVTAERVEDDWQIDVADNGIGIDPEYEDKVFIIFQRLHGRDVFPGTGIGLALAKKIAEFHGGRIHLVNRDPDDGPGATLRVTLPVAPDTQEPTE